MNKRNFLTVIGITLSFIIAIGGWFLTSTLIEIKSEKLLSTSFSVATNKLDGMSLSITSKIPENVKDDLPLVRLNLAEDEIVSILRNWDSAGRETPHEPTKEQLNMEQAIDSGREWFSFISSLNIFPEEWLRFNNARAYLFQKLPLNQGEQFLSPEYSYWSITYKNESLNVNMVINAVTGQVWKTDIDIFKADISINDYDITNALSAFVSALEVNNESGEITTDGLSISPVQNGNKNKIVGEVDNVNITVTAKGDFESLMDSYDFGNGNRNAVVMATGWQSEDGRWNINTFKMHLINN